MNSNLQQEFETFMSDFESKLTGVGLSLDKYPIDHICFRVSEIKNYEHFLKVFTKMSKLYASRIHNGRKFTIFLLKTPLTYKEFKINVLEYSEPGGSDNYDQGFQHIEFLSKDKMPKLESDSSIISEDAYVKWPDKIVAKLTSEPILIHVLSKSDALVKVS